VADTLLTEAEAARRLRVCTKTLRGFRKNGLIRYVALTGRKILYRPEDCDAFVDAKSKTDDPIEHPQPRPRARPARGKAGNVVSFTAMRRERRGLGAGA
jgi:hypothetical protein